MSNNLGVVELVTNQANKESTINNMVGVLDGAISGLIIYEVTSSNALAISGADLKTNQVFKITSSGATAAIAATLDAGVQRGVVTIWNASGFAVTVKVSGDSGAGVTLADGAIELLLVGTATAPSLGGAVPPLDPKATLPIFRQPEYSPLSGSGFGGNTFAGSFVHVEETVVVKGVRAAIEGGSSGFTMNAGIYSTTNRDLHGATLVATSATETPTDGSVVDMAFSSAVTLTPGDYYIGVQMIGSGTISPAQTAYDRPQSFFATSGGVLPGTAPSVTNAPATNQTIWAY